MRCASTSIKNRHNIAPASDIVSDVRPQLVFMFAGLEWFKDPAVLTRLAAVDDGSLSLLAIGFDSPDARIEWSQAEVPGIQNSFSAGAALAQGISTEVCGMRWSLRRALT